MNRSNGTWVKNMCQTFENLFMDVDKFVCKEPVLFVGNQMETVGENVKNFFSGFVDDFVLPQVVDPVLHVAQSVPSKSINLGKPSTSSAVETKEKTVDSHTNSPNEAPLVPKESCDNPSSTGLCHSEQITSEVTKHLIDERESLTNKTSDNTTQVNLNASTNSQNLENRSEEEGALYDESLCGDATAFEYSDWGIENIIDLNLDTDYMFKEDPLINVEEKEALLNSPIDELECSSNSSTTNQLSELDGTITCNENKEENAEHVISGGLSSEEKGVLYDESLCGDDNPSVNLEEKKTLLNSPVDELEWNMNSSTTHQPSELEGAITCNENKEENSEHIISGGLSSEEKGVLYDESLSSDDNPSVNLEEKKTLLNSPVDEVECDSNTSTTHESSEHIISDGLSSEKLYESLNSPFRNANVGPDTLNYNPTSTVDYKSVSSDNLSSCESFTTLAYDSDNEASLSCSGTGLADASTVNLEDAKNDTDVESCVIVEHGKFSGFPNPLRTKSYKKMIQDAFMSRKRLTKEYKQLAIWYGDIEKELCQPTKFNSSKQPVQDLPDSEWELL